MKDKEDIILEYLQRTNRPYSAIDIFNNLKGKIPKTMVVKCLNSMVESERIKGKLYGKQWVYVARQDLLDCPTQEQIAVMDDRIDELKSEIATCTTTNKSLDTELSDLLNSKTDLDLAQEIQEFEIKIQTLEKKLNQLENGQVQVSQELKIKIDQELLQMNGYWKSRKKIFKNIWDTITESLPGSKKEFMEELGIEED
jgi:26S proteasome regulatory subunit (ATPase 3-interacting protein)